MVIIKHFISVDYFIPKELLRAWQKLWFNFIFLWKESFLLVTNNLVIHNSYEEETIKLKKFNFRIEMDISVFPFKKRLWSKLLQMQFLVCDLETDKNVLEICPKTMLDFPSLSLLISSPFVTLSLQIQKNEIASVSV